MNQSSESQSATEYPQLEKEPISFPLVIGVIVVVGLAFSALGWYLSGRVAQSRIEQLTDPRFAQLQESIDNMPKLGMNFLGATSTKDGIVCGFSASSTVVAFPCSILKSQ